MLIFTIIALQLVATAVALAAIGFLDRSGEPELEPVRVQARRR